MYRFSVCIAPYLISHYSFTYNESMTKEKKIKYPNKIKELRVNLNFTQKDVALKLGLTNSEDRISHWEHGLMMPNGTNLLKLAKILGVRAEDIYLLI